MSMCDDDDDDGDDDDDETVHYLFQNESN